MIIKLTALLTSLFLLCISCKKDAEEKIVTPVYAGETESSFYTQTYDPPMTIDISWDSQNHYGIGKDSLDLDGNGSYDFIFHLNIIREDSAEIIGMPDPFPRLNATVRNGYSLAVIPESFGIGLGQSATVYFVDDFGEGELINSSDLWQGEGFNEIQIWGENPNNGMTPSFGNWYYSNTSKYIGYKKENDRYGWIELDCTNPYDPVITGHSLSSESN